MFKQLAPPSRGDAITMTPRGLNVPDQPIIPYVEGDGTGPDIWRASVKVLDAAVELAYGSRRKIQWFEVFAGQKSFDKFGTWLPDDTLAAFNHYLVGIKGPLTTPVGGGIRSLNVALRQKLDLFVCLRPVRYFAGVPSPVKHPQRVDMVIFRENTEDIYAGIEFAAGSDKSQKVLDFLAREFPDEFAKIRFGDHAKSAEWLRRLEASGAPKREAAVEVGIGIKPISYLGTERLIHSAISYAVKHGRKSVTLVHKGNIMKYTEGSFRDWGYKVAKNFFGAVDYEGGPWQIIPAETIAKIRAAESGSPVQNRDSNGAESLQSRDRKGADSPVSLDQSRAGKEAGNFPPGLLIKDAIADITLQQVLTRPEDFDIIATLNLNGDYLSDALAAQVGGIGIAPGGNINGITGHAIFEATHGTAPKYANQDKVNPGSVILSGEMMLRYMGWTQAADLVIQGMDRAIAAREVTYDFERLMREDGKPVKLLKCSEFAQAVIEFMG